MSENKSQVPSIEELQKAVKLIHDLCVSKEGGYSRNNGCKTCPFSRGEDDCLIIESSPNNWCLSEEPVQKLII